MKTESSVLLALAETNRAEYDRLMVLSGPEYRAAIAVLVAAPDDVVQAWQLLVGEIFTDITASSNTFGAVYKVLNINEYAVTAELLCDRVGMVADFQFNETVKIN